jgi:hypothetical protein
MTNILENHSKSILIIVLLITLAHGLILLNDGQYLDDWTVFNVDDDAVMDTYKRAGVPLKGLMHISLNEFTFGYRLITFFSILLSSILLFHILKSIKEINPIDRLLLVLIFSLFPVNFSKVSSCITTYIFCSFLFFLGSFLLNKYLLTKRFVYQICALIVLFLSFQIESLLFFYSVPFLLILYHEKLFSGLPSSLLKLKKHLSFILLPFAYFIFKALFLKTSGFDYETYNDIHAKFVILAPLKFILSIYSTIIFPILETFRNEQHLVGLVFTFPICLYLYFTLRNKHSDDKNNLLAFFSLGWFAYMMGIIPYLLIRDTETNFGAGWLSRDQLVLPVGIAFILLYSLKAIIKELEINKKIMTALLSLCIAGFVSANIVNCLDFQRYWFKQLSIIEAFKKSDIVRNNTTFLVKDELADINLFGDPIRNTTYNGIAKYVYGDETRYILDQVYSDAEWFNKDLMAKLSKLPELNMSDYVFTKPQYLITLKPGTYPRSLTSAAKLLLMKYINKSKFEEKIKDILYLEYEKL